MLLLLINIKKKKWNIFSSFCYFNNFAWQISLYWLCVNCLAVWLTKDDIFIFLQFLSRLSLFQILIGFDIFLQWVKIVFLQEGFCNIIIFTCHAGVWIQKIDTRNIFLQNTKSFYLCEREFMHSFMTITCRFIYHIIYICKSKVGQIIHCVNVCWLQKVAKVKTRI